MKQLSKSLILSTQGLILVLCLPYLLQAQQKANPQTGTLSIAGTATIQYGSSTMGLGDVVYAQKTREMINHGKEGSYRIPNIKKHEYYTFSPDGVYYAKSYDSHKDGTYKVDFYKSGSNVPYETKRLPNGILKISSDGKHYLIYDAIYEELNFYSHKEKDPLKTINIKGYDEVKISRNGSVVAISMSGNKFNDKILVYKINGKKLFEKNLQQNKYRLLNIELSPLGNYVIANLEDLDLSPNTSPKIDSLRKSNNNLNINFKSSEVSRGGNRVLLFDKIGNELNAPDSPIRGIGRFQKNEENAIIVKGKKNIRIYDIPTLRSLNQIDLKGLDRIIRYQLLNNMDILLITSEYVDMNEDPNQKKQMLRPLFKSSREGDITQELQLVKITTDGNLYTNKIINRKNLKYDNHSYHILELGYIESTSEILVIINDKLNILQ